MATPDVRLDPASNARDLSDAIGRLSADPAVDALFVQLPLLEHVRTADVRRRLDSQKDVDCLAHENLGRLVAVHPRFVPATTAAVCRLLDAYDVPTDGRDLVVVGRSDAVDRPLANRLLQGREPGNATVTVCHSRTADLRAVTRSADIVVTGCGVPELVDGSMLSPGVVIVDVSANRRAAERRADGD